jgi:hypothetical protein
MDLDRGIWMWIHETKKLDVLSRRLRGFSELGTLYGGLRRTFMGIFLFYK